jgi:hypothetical protein
LIPKVASWEGIILSTSFAHLVTNGRSSIAYLAERVGMHDGINDMLDARQGRISIKRTSSSLVVGVLSDERMFIDRVSISVAKVTPSTHKDWFHDLTSDKCLSSSPLINDG